MVQNRIEDFTQLMPKMKATPSGFVLSLLIKLWRGIRLGRSRLETAR